MVDKLEDNVVGVDAETMEDVGVLAALDVDEANFGDDEEADAAVVALVGVAVAVVEVTVGAVGEEQKKLGSFATWYTEDRGAPFGLGLAYGLREIGSVLRK